MRLRRRLADALAEKQHAQAQLAAMALTDPQTNLPHRPLLQDRLEQLLAALRRDGDHAALFVLEWPETTQCQAILCHLQKVTREVDTLGHLGDRTIILLLGALPRDVVQARAQAEQVAARILSILSEFGPPVSALILCDSTANGEDLLRQAENAICYAQR
jgi:GGDEF domain-containing protein